MTALSYLDPWTISYTGSVNNPVRRTENIGKKVQAKNSHREILTASATRVLQGAQTPYLEYFLREVADGGKFTDYYADGNGTQQGEIRLVGGYRITPFGSHSIIECQIEVFR